MENHTMILGLPAALLTLTILGPAPTTDGAIIDTTDAVHFQAPAGKGKAELLPGKFGKAVRFSFAGGGGAFFTRPTHATPDWDKAAGISFWLKGEGSNHCGSLELINDEDYAVRDAYAFPLNACGMVASNAARMPPTLSI
jgi:hypothetical protein